MDEKLLEIKDLSVHYVVEDETVKALTDINLTLLKKKHWDW